MVTEDGLWTEHYSTIRGFQTKSNPSSHHIILCPIKKIFYIPMPSHKCELVKFDCNRTLYLSKVFEKLGKTTMKMRTQLKHNSNADEKFRFFGSSSL